MSTPRRRTRRHTLLDDLRQLGRGGLAAEFVAGTITAILIIPQAIAYALIAGVPPTLGLCAAIVAPVLYGFLGSSRTAILGPAAVQAAMVGAALLPLAAADEPLRIAGALAIGVISGAMLVALGLLRLGWLTNFISHPVLSGFTTGAVLYIIVTQLGGLLGIKLPQDASSVAAALKLIEGLPSIKPATALCGVLAVVLLLLARRAGPALARLLELSGEYGLLLGRVAPLLVVLLFTVLSSSLQLAAHYGVGVVGDIPAVLPHPDWTRFHGADWRGFAGAAALIALVGYIETLSIAKALAFRRRERISPDRELIALGLTNLGVAALGGMPVAGSFSKSMVNSEAGARTQLSGLIAATWVALCAAFVTGLLHELPRAVLAAIIIVAVAGLIDFRSLRETWNYDRGDGAAQAVTIAAVLAFGIEQGLLMGSALAVLLFLYKTSRPRIIVVGLVPGTQHFRSVHRNDVMTLDHLLLIRIDENLYFANTPRVETELQRLVAEHPTATDVVLILSGIGYIDASSLAMLDQFEDDLAKTGVRLHLAEFKSQVIDRLRGTALFERLSPDRVHRSTYELIASFDSGLF